MVKYVSCEKCGVVFNDEVAIISKYKVYEDMGCNIQRNKCPVCKDLGDITGDTYAFDEKELSEFV